MCAIWGLYHSGRSSACLDKTLSDRPSYTSWFGMFTCVPYGACTIVVGAVPVWTKLCQIDQVMPLGLGCLLVCHMGPVP